MVIISSLERSFSHPDVVGIFYFGFIYHTFGVASVWYRAFCFFSAIAVRHGWLQFWFKDFSVVC